MNLTMKKDYTEPLFKYNWNLKETTFTKDKGTVFSCFSCGGGSSFGYKLAGFDVIGMNEIDPKMASCYIENHNPKYAFIEPIQTFKLRKDLPKELYNLDILDGSPPCSSFSMSGNREKDWGKEKIFREGQSEQVLDTLFFDFIDLANELQPKVVIAENVKGLLLGNAREYVRNIYREFDKAGYYCQHFLLNASKMGVPQKRERVFFICLRKDIAEPFLIQKDLFLVQPKLNLYFNCKPVLFQEIYDGLGKPITEYAHKAWLHRKPNDLGIADSKAHAKMKVSDMNNSYLKLHKTPNTLTAKGHHGFIHYDKPVYVSDTEMIKMSSFPSDYNYMDSKPGYLMGMSVPPIMIANIANEIYKQWNTIF